MHVDTGWQHVKEERCEGEEGALESPLLIIVNQLISDNEEAQEGEMGDSTSFFLRGEQG